MLNVLFLQKKGVFPVYNYNNYKYFCRKTITKLFMKKLLFISIILFNLESYSQTPKIRFDYDEAGNQSLRTFCINCTARLSEEPIKDVSDIKDEDLQKFNDSDSVSFYPNPVSSSLYIKWDDNESKVINVEIFTLSGQLIKILDGSLSNTCVLSFENYAAGIYIVELNYENGNTMPIKIIKE